MKRLFTILFMLLGFLGIASAQTFSVSATEVWKIAPHTEFDVEGHFVLTNLTNTTQTIKWERTEIQITPDCHSQICDLNLCYYYTVSTKTFDIEANATGNIITHFINPNAIEGAAAIIRLKMSNNANPADSIPVMFLFTSPLSGTGDLPVAQVKLFPNPTTDYFRLDNAEAVSRIRVFSLDNREVARFTATPNEQYSLATQPAGTYILALEDAKGQVFQALELVKK